MDLHKAAISRGSLARAVSFFGFWLVLSGVNPIDLVIGALAAVAATWASLHLLPVAQSRLNFVALAKLVLRFPGQSVVAGINVACRALDPRMPLQPGVVIYRPRLPSGPMRNSFCIMTGLQPGTLPCGADENGDLVIHCLDTSQPVLEQLAAEEALFAQALGFRMAMTDFLVGAAIFILAMVTLGLVRIFRGPTEADRMMSAQLLGSGGVAVLLLLAVAAETPAIVDVALMLALLAAFASVAFVVNARIRPERVRDKRPAMRIAVDVFTVVAVSCGAFFFLAGTVGLLRFPGLAYTAARVDEGGQSRSRTGYARTIAAGCGAARRPQAHQRLGLCSTLRRNRLAGCRAAGPAIRAAGMSMAAGFDILLAVLLVSLAVWIVAARSRSRPSSYSWPTDCWSGLPG